MEKVNGDANINAVSHCIRSGVERFTFISTVENNLPDFVLKGYFNGKRRAEAAVCDAYPETGTVLRPSFVYGTRKVLYQESAIYSEHSLLPLLPTLYCPMIFSCFIMSEIYCTGGKCVYSSRINREVHLIFTSLPSSYTP